MGVAFLQRSGRNADKFRLFLELFEIARADIPHGGAQSADKLMQHACQRPLVGHLPLDAFRYEFEHILYVLLEIAVGGAARHGADRPHAPIRLVGPALIQKHLAGAFIGSGEQRANHGAVRPGGERLGDIAGIFDAAVGDDRNVRLLRLFG